MLKLLVSLLQLSDPNFSALLFAGETAPRSMIDDLAPTPNCSQALPVALPLARAVRTRTCTIWARRRPHKLERWWPVPTTSISECNATNFSYNSACRSFPSLPSHLLINRQASLLLSLPPPKSASLFNGRSQQQQQVVLANSCAPKRGGC